MRLLEHFQYASARGEKLLCWTVQICIMTPNVLFQIIYLSAYLRFPIGDSKYTSQILHVQNWNNLPSHCLWSDTSSLSSKLRHKIWSHLLPLLFSHTPKYIQVLTTLHHPLWYRQGLKSLSSSKETTVIKSNLQSPPPTYSYS